ncbi:glutathione S-transferase family protein [Polaromonas sp.]|uniref:glutathione S-transferase family protein n=1 Tax=Polaromonas sp. TaxID=1869339 RepID=UPI00286C9B55|nr:glutathione S-transferase family protein [Polaromonas sp.]
MSEMILHHYPSSPFSEKVRLILGYKHLSWRSVVIPMVSPKPDLVALTGGYRKTPVLQIGADIYCDTALICDVLEHLQPMPTLYPEPSKGMARTLAHWADNTLFWTSMAYNMQPKGLAQIFGNAPPEVAKAFIDDRKAMAVGLARLRPADAAAAYKSYLRRMSDMLDDLPFLLGEMPSICDFAMYHPLWFTRIRASVLADILNATPAVLDWMDRMAAIGHGSMEKFSAADAIAVAAASMPAPLHDTHDNVFQDEHGIALGSRVQVSSESFGPEPTEGELMAATRMHYTLRRTDERAGTVHVHLPRIGYTLKAVKTA